MVSGKICLCCGPGMSWLMRRRTRTIKEAPPRKARRNKPDVVVMRPQIDDYDMRSAGEWDGCYSIHARSPSTRITLTPLDICHTGSRKHVVYIDGLSAVSCLFVSIIQSCLHTQLYTVET